MIRQSIVIPTVADACFLSLLCHGSLESLSIFFSLIHFWLSLAKLYISEVISIFTYTDAFFSLILHSKAVPGHTMWNTTFYIAIIFAIVMTLTWVKKSAASLLAPLYTLLQCVGILSKPLQREDNLPQPFSQLQKERQWTTSFTWVLVSCLSSVSQPF